MTALVSDEDRQRLARLLGMMGSQHDGEALNAARLACQMVQRLRLQWADLLGSEIADENHPTYVRGFQAGYAYAQRSARPTVRSGPWWCSAAQTILDSFEVTEWEDGFLRSLAARRYPLTSRQEEVLTRLREKYR